MEASSFAGPAGRKKTRGLSVHEQGGGEWTSAALCPTKRDWSFETRIMKAGHGGADSTASSQQGALYSGARQGSQQSYSTSGQVWQAAHSAWADRRPGLAKAAPRRAYSSQDCTNCCSRCSPEEMRVSEKWVQVQPVPGVVFFTVLSR